MAGGVVMAGYSGSGQKHRAMDTSTPESIARCNGAATRQCQFAAHCYSVIRSNAEAIVSSACFVPNGAQIVGAPRVMPSLAGCTIQAEFVLYAPGYLVSAGKSSTVYTGAISADLMDEEQKQALLSALRPMYPGIFSEPSRLYESPPHALLCEGDAGLDAPLYPASFKFDVRLAVVAAAFPQKAIEHAAKSLRELSTPALVPTHAIIICPHRMPAIKNCMHQLWYMDDRGEIQPPTDAIRVL